MVSLTQQQKLVSLSLPPLEFIHLHCSVHSTESAESPDCCRALSSQEALQVPF